MHRLAQGLTSQWAELVRLHQLVLEQCEDQQIHDLRVASRRLRSLLELLAPTLGRHKLRRLRRPIRRLTRELGQLRNVDEARRYLSGLQEVGLAPLAQQLELQRCSELQRTRQLLEGLPRKQLDRLILQASQRLQKPAETVSTAVYGWLSERNLSLYQAIQQFLQLPGLAELPEERHRLRIAIKKWRYFNELLAMVCARPHDQLVTLLKQYQSLLGNLNDREVFLGMLQAAAELPDPVRERAAVVIESQHHKLVQQFNRLLQRTPLQYQFYL